MYMRRTTGRENGQPASFQSLNTLWLFGIWVALLVLGLTDAAGAQDQPDDNPVINPGFELVVNGDPVGWNRYTPIGDAGASTVSSDSRTGDFSLLIDVDQARQLRPDLQNIRQGWNQRFSLDAGGWADPGEMHTVSFYYKTDGDPNLRLQIERRLQERNEAGNHKTDNDYIPISPSSDWTHIEFDIRWPHPDTHTDWGLLVMFIVQHGESGKVWIDDVRLSKKTPIDEDRPPGTFYVSPDGDDGQAGTLDAPWRTLSHASRYALPGDTIVFLPGEYHGVLQPLRSGTAESPIIFKALDRRSARLTGGYGAEFAVHLSGLDHIHLEGFHIKPASSSGRWMLINDSRHIRVDDVLMEKATGSMPFHVMDSEHVYVRDSVIREYVGGNMARVSHSKWIVFEGNAISRTGHSPFQFYPEGSNQFVVVRGNVFHAAWGRAFEFFATRDLLFENNIVTNAFDGGRSASSNAKILSQNGIFRFNRVFRNWGGPISASPQDEWQFRGIRLYNNVFDDNLEYGLATNVGAENVQDVLYVNNIFSRNDIHGRDRQVQFTGTGSPVMSPEGPMPRVWFLNNAIVPNESGFKATIGFAGQAWDIDTMEDTSWREMSAVNQSIYLADNTDESPQFVDPSNYNHALSSGSSLLSGGRFLTTAVGCGCQQVNVITVEDASYFYDGFGIPGELGDLVAIGNPNQLARVVGVDRDDNKITLDRSVKWYPGMPVSFPWSGQGPDIGPYEHGDRVRPSVQVVATPFMVQPGQPVHLSAVLRGIDDPEEIRWQLGDGTLAHGAELTHHYNEPYDYPIRVKVTTASGHVYRGVGYVVVEWPRPIDEPWVHSTFDGDDEDWWWLWKAYRPFPAEYARELDPATDSGVLRVSNPGEGRLPLKLAPWDWDVDRYPLIYLRYRIQPGTPIGFYLDAFAGPQGSRRTWIATVQADVPAPVHSSLQYELIDDDQWHTLLIDARRIRYDFHDVHVLQRFGVETVGPSEEGDTYWLDEVAILSVESALREEWQDKLTIDQRQYVQSMADGTSVIPELHGVLVNRYGLPKGGFIVGLDGKQTTTSEQGTFVLTDVSVGPHTVTIYTDDQQVVATQEVYLMHPPLFLTLYVKDDDNPILNPGFESINGGSPAHWGLYVPTGLAQGAKISTDARTGHYSVLLDAAAGRGGTEYPTARIHRTQRLAEDAGGWAQPGATYRFSAYYKTEGDPRASLVVERRTEDGKADNVSKNFPPSEQWTLAELDFEWPFTEFGALLTVRINNATEGKVWFDDVNLVRIED